MISGLDVLKTNPSLSKDWGQCALLSNQASISADYTPSWSVVREHLGERLKVLLGPQHGFISTVQDNMIETDHAVHADSGLPIYSLYSEHREPTAEMLSDVDTIIVDLQITGCRVYTYKYSMAGCLRAAKAYKKKVVVLDRANPLGGTRIEGPCLEPQVKSFVGEFPIPMRHGMTIGEAARCFNKNIGCDLEVVSLQEWDPNKYWHQLDQKWVLPSPNLPVPECLYTYPGTVLLEGTNISEGRGTCLPFLFIGAPYLKDPKTFAQRITQIYGAHDDAFFLRETCFQPSFQKWAGEVCQGVQVHISNPAQVKMFQLGLSIIRATFELAPESFAWSDPGYEYNFELEPIKMLVGRRDTIELLTGNNFSIDDPVWSEGVSAYHDSIQDILLYPRTMKF